MKIFFSQIFKSLSQNLQGPCGQAGRVVCQSLLLMGLVAGCGGGGEANTSANIPNTIPNSGTGNGTGSVTPPTGDQTGGQLQPLGVNSLGQAPNVDGHYPDLAGFYPNAQGSYPDKNGVYPSAEQAGLYANESGVARSYSSAGSIDQRNAFFKPFGNGRSCASCHQQSDGFSITPNNLEVRFNASKGNDPIFMLNDGATSPLAPVATLSEKRLAYKMLIEKGLIRIGMAIPANAEFEIIKIIDPYQYASPGELSLFRRPLPSANLSFVSDVMWDGRETAIDANAKDCLPGPICFASMSINLAHQANGATLGHAQAAQGLSEQEQMEIVDFEKTLFSAQVFDKNARFLDAANGRGGPVFLQEAPFYFGINDFISGNLKTGAAFNKNVMSNFTLWQSKTGTTDVTLDAARKSIARGELIFNTRTFNPKNGPDIRNDLSVPLNRVTCSSCHNTPQAGSASAPLAVSIFTSEADQRTPDLPLYTLRNKLNENISRTTDPGVAMRTGKWNDIGRFKVPTLRGLAARPPYFHNGAAESLIDVVQYYDQTFSLRLTTQEQNDLVAFLAAL